MRSAALLLALALLASCATAPAPPPTVAPPQAPLIGPHGFDLNGMKTSVNACDDFYDFAVGGWRESHPLPATYSRFGRFEEVAARNRLTLRTILEESAAASHERGSAGQKLGDFYSACVAEAAIDSSGLAAIQPQLDRIAAIDDRGDVAAEIVRLQQQGIHPFFRLSAQNDYKRSRQIIAAVSQSGLGLPDRDYYLRDDDRFTKIRAAYVDHMAKMFELAGVAPNQARSDARRVLEVETRLARAAMARVEQRNPENIYNVTAVTTFAEAMPSVDWRGFLRAVGLENLQTLNVSQPAYLREADRVIAEAPLESLEAYLRWHYLDAMAATLPTPFVNQDFEFRGRTLTGQKAMQPRWVSCVRAADTNLGQLLGQEYVRRAFTPEAKAKMNELIDNLIAALREDIPRLAWMGPETKARALEKLNAFSRRIGYPETWIDYTPLEMRRDSYAANVAAARTFAFRRSINRIGKPDDANEWGFFTPATVNAGYNPPQNNITFPAGILQPPFYDPHADDAYNYGGIGMVIGHEMTHGFDDQGSKFDAEGNLVNWWTDEDKKKFDARAECIANQYSEFVVEPGLNISGKLVTGEAIGDLGGVTIAYRAFQRAQQGKSRTIVDGFTPEQRFFLGFAQVWGENLSAEEARQRALTDVHAQGPFRVNGTVANMPEFWQAWKCSDSAPMVRAAAKRCDIW